jgi:uncharacterized protein YbbK (DUF523 family)/uncharacterized protein YbgA (DUF1722 family)
VPSAELLKIGTSQCLLGERVRYDGGHKANLYVLDVITPHFELIPVCPEVEAGMGVPREPVKLVSSEGDLKMVGVSSGSDKTEAMSELAIRRVEELKQAGLSGYIFKAGSPSCGLDVDARGSADKVKGLFAEAVTKAIPGIPVIDEGALADLAAREGWVERVFAFSRQMQFIGKPRSVGQLTMAHAQAKLQLEVHAPDAYEELFGFLRENSKKKGWEELSGEYLARFMEVLETPASEARHFETLKEVFNGVKPGLEGNAVKDLARILQDYRQGNLPLGVPLMLLRHYVRAQDHPTLNGQTYLEPGPRELVLRTRV